MKAIIQDVTLSSSILNVTAKILPFTEEGKMMPAAMAHDVVVELSIALRLASCMEQELSVHRLGEASILARTSLEAEATTALCRLVTDPAGKVVKVDFGGGQKE